MVVRRSPNQLTRASGAGQSSSGDPDQRDDRQAERQFPGSFDANLRGGCTFPRSSDNAADHHHDYDNVNGGGGIASRNHYYSRTR